MLHSKNPAILFYKYSIQEMSTYSNSAMGTLKNMRNMFKVNNKKTELRQWRCSRAFVVNFEIISHFQAQTNCKPNANRTCLGAPNFWGTSNQSRTFCFLKSINIRILNTIVNGSTLVRSWERLHMWSSKLIHFLMDTEIFQSDSLRNLVPFVQFKKREKHPWRRVTFNKVAGWSQKHY